MYWILATLAEGWFGLGDRVKAQSYIDQAAKLDPRRRRG